MKWENDMNDYIQFILKTLDIPTDLKIDISWGSDNTLYYDNKRNTARITIKDKFYVPHVFARLKLGISYDPLIATPKFKCENNTEKYVKVFHSLSMPILNAWTWLLLDKYFPATVVDNMVLKYINDAKKNIPTAGEEVEISNISPDVFANMVNLYLILRVLSKDPDKVLKIKKDKTYKLFNSVVDNLYEVSMEKPSILPVLSYVKKGIPFIKLDVEENDVIGKYIKIDYQQTATTS